ncbi:hypothetical protein HS1genome_0153 [Sulfodiicoccus acidiphilus]|uniref:Uncharacterized protein n=1 Tax=Sulfodiicoccus acidiphilus TaxID=1670455 RepID=A0A348B0R2_9CREN|nr:hypothetical protein [Sulfodiicoccus acidiphilus]BBD71764.1 hypothetical protein HS1genome_0153 [Sulfodiicoccus acidiphilus]GGT99077.1 hypothetical protein GCM10007116_15480 [Sulfodiicoccus acidiphilus]
MQVAVRTNFPQDEKVIAINVDGKPVYDFSPNLIPRGDRITPISLAGIMPTRGEHTLEILTEGGKYVKFPFKL